MKQKAQLMGPPMDLWDKLYPIMTVEDPESSALTHYIYINTYFEMPNEFSEIIGLLDTAKAGETVVFKINSGGGILDSVLMLIDGVRACEASVVCELSGTVASAATMLTLACDDIYVAPHTEFMVHNFSGGASGKGHEIIANVDSMISTQKVFYNDIYKHFLTKQEIKDVIAGQDMYLTADEVYERFNKVKEKRQKKLAKYTKKQEKEQEQAIVELVESLGYDVAKAKTTKDKEDD